jgi:hypothetical protein
MDAIGLLGKVNARINVVIPHTPPIMAPSIGPSVIATIITVRWIMVRLNAPIGI